MPCPGEVVSHARPAQVEPTVRCGRTSGSAVKALVTSASPFQQAQASSALVDTARIFVIAGRAHIFAPEDAPEPAGVSALSLGWIPRCCRRAPVQLRITLWTTTRGSARQWHLPGDPATFQTPTPTLMVRRAPLRPVTHHPEMDSRAGRAECEIRVARIGEADVPQAFPRRILGRIRYGPAGAGHDLHVDGMQGDLAGKTPKLISHRQRCSYTATRRWASIHSG